LRSVTPVPLPLLRLDHADRPRRQQAANGEAGVEQHEHVERVAVLAERGRDETEIEREGAALRQHGLEAERPGLSS
jgi:hypothetical protein